MPQKRTPNAFVAPTSPPAPSHSTTMSPESATVSRTTQRLHVYTPQPKPSDLVGSPTESAPSGYSPTADPLPAKWSSLPRTLPAAAELLAEMDETAGAGISWKKARGSLARCEATIFPSSVSFFFFRGIGVVTKRGGDRGR